VQWQHRQPHLILQHLRARQLMILPDTVSTRSPLLVHAYRPSRKVSYSVDFSSLSAPKAERRRKYRPRKPAVIGRLPYKSSPWIAGQSLPWCWSAGSLALACCLFVPEVGWRRCAAFC